MEKIKLEEIKDFLESERSVLESERSVLERGKRYKEDVTFLLEYFQKQQYEIYKLEKRCGIISTSVIAQERANELLDKILILVREYQESPMPCSGGI